MLAFVQWQFTIAQMTFVIQSLFAIYINVTGYDNLTINHIGLIVFFCFSPLAWQRDVSVFKFGMMFGFLMIVITLFVISYFCISKNLNQLESAPGFIPFNENSYWNFIGFSFFMFEGIGGVLPLMAMTEDRTTFITLLKGCLILLCFTYIAFAELGYYTFGENLNSPIIMNMMPNKNWIIILCKGLFIINLVFSYPLCIYMTNIILE
jgi:amino acid permease